MARARFLSGFCFMILVAANAIRVQSGVVPGLGVNWGTMASHPLDPHIVVDMIKANNITRVKLFDSDSWTVNALAGSGLEVMLGIPNNMLHHLAKDYDNAKDWAKENVTKHLSDSNTGVDIRYVAVGNEAFLTSYNGTFDKVLLPAMQNIQKAINAAGHGDKIKITTPLNADVYTSGSDKPSDGIFRGDIRDIMNQIVKFLHDNDSPFVVNVYPFISLYQNPDFPFDYAFFDGGGRSIRDKNVSYSNVFDANYDTLVWSLKRAGYPDLKIIVGEVGWPTDGVYNANVNNAKRFYDGLMKKLAANKGTPLRPGKLEVYLFGLMDEDQKSILPGNFERHWGMFQYDGKPKFPMDLSGKGNDKMLVAAKGVEYLPAQWCVLNNDVKNLSRIPDEIGYACSMSDCTSLTYGGSCNDLDIKGNVSYAFNMYYQMNDQDVEACDFNGLATIVKTNASEGNCLFPVQIVSAGEKLRLAYAASIIAGFILTFFSLM